MELLSLPPHIVAGFPSQTASQAELSPAMGTKYGAQEQSLPLLIPKKVMSGTVRQKSKQTS